MTVGQRSRPLHQQKHDSISDDRTSPVKYALDRTAAIEVFGRSPGLVQSWFVFGSFVTPPGSEIIGFNFQGVSKFQLIGRGYTPYKGAKTPCTAPTAIGTAYQLVALPG